jgi:putative addiction module killer protein
MTLAYRDWINSLADRAGRARIQVRIDRLVHGNPGKFRRITAKVSELKIEFGPGYRVYYSERGTQSIMLLAAGDKSTQRRDIRNAIELADSLEDEDW